MNLLTFSMQTAYRRWHHAKLFCASVMLISMLICLVMRVQTVAASDSSALTRTVANLGDIMLASRRLFIISVIVNAIYLSLILKRLIATRKKEISVYASLWRCKSRIVTMLALEHSTYLLIGSLIGIGLASILIRFVFTSLN